jgi:hypothetical protein
VHDEARKQTSKFRPGHPRGMPVSKSKKDASATRNVNPITEVPGLHNQVPEKRLSVTSFVYQPITREFTENATFQALGQRNSIWRLTDNFPEKTFGTSCTLPNR